jgi:hypothetical protein
MDDKNQLYSSPRPLCIKHLVAVDVSGHIGDYGSERWRGGGEGGRGGNGQRNEKAKDELMAPELNCFVGPEKGMREASLAAPAIKMIPASWVTSDWIQTAVRTRESHMTLRR